MKKIAENGISLFKIRFFPRLLTLFLSFCCLCHTPVLRAGEPTLTLQFHNAPLKSVLQSIARQSGCKFLYKDRFVETRAPVSISFTGTVEDALAQLAGQCDFRYELSDNKLIVLAASPQRPPTEQNRVEGRVTDSSGKPVAGCMVRIAGTLLGTTTDAEGRYELPGIDRNAVLEFSFLGMTSRSVAVAGKSRIDVVLREAAMDVDEVVVIGYGVVRKSDFTGSVASVRPAELENNTSYNIEQALKGRAAGVRVVTNSSSPGSRVEINIRGGNSMIAGNTPLYVVDGFALTGGIDFLNPADIETMDILKDASATAIYGSRGANGVVVITTRQGARGEGMNVSVNTMYGVQTDAKRYRMLDARQYAVVANEWLRNDKQLPHFDLDIIRDRGTDWQELIFRNAPIQDHTVRLSGSGPKTRYMISGNYFAQDGILKGTGVRRGSARINLQSDMKKWLSVSFNTNLSRRQKEIQDVDNGSLGNNVFSGALAAPPTLLPYDEKGQINQIQTRYSFTSPDIKNPLLFLQNKNSTVRNAVLGNLSLDFKLLPGLTLKTLFGLEYETYLNERYEPIIYENDFGYASEQSYSRNSFLSENTLSYARTFREKHALNLVAGFTYQNNRSRSHTINVSKFTSNITENYNLGSAELVDPPSSSYSDWVLASFLGRLNYAYDDRYLFTFSFRADGSSRFGINHKWGFFPSGAFAWRISEERFLQEQRTVSDLKLRVSYGITGNTALAPYQTLDRLSSVRYIFSDHKEEIGYAPSAIANKDLKWESTAQFDAGLDAGFFDNRLTLTFDYYRKRTRDLLASSPVPWSTGFRTTLKNMGEIENRGLEFSLTAQPVHTRQVTWSLSGNISRNRNEVIRLEKGSDIIGGGILFSSMNIAREGEPLGAFYGYIEEGLDPAGFIRYQDVNEDGVLNSSDRVILGSPYPDFTYGVTSNLKYKNFTLNLFFEGSHGNEVFWETAGSHLNSFQKGTNQFAELYGRYWTADNPDPGAAFPKISKDTNFNTSDRFVKDGSYLRLKSLTLTYTLPTKKLGIRWLQSAQIYFQATNLFTVTDYPGLDPDVNTRGNDSDVISSRLMIGIDASAYPLARTFSGGIRLKF